MLVTLGSFADFCNFLMICGISLAILLLFNAIVIMYSYTLRIASGHNEFGSHFAAADVENVWL